MADEIEKPEVGDPVNKLWETVAELVDAVNALNKMQVSPKDIGEFKYADGNVMLVLKTETCDTV